MTKHDFIKKVSFTVIAFFMLIPLKLYASTQADPVPDDLFPAVNNLLDYAESCDKGSLNLDLISRVLDFIDAPKALGVTMSLGERDGAVSDYYEFSVNRSLGEVLDLAYNPDLPSNLTLPSSVRRSQWMKLNDKNVTLPRFSDELCHLDKPLIINGIEYIENSPDTFSGAYYAYNVDRLLILIKHNGRPALISVSNQRGKSDVGRKGLILGEDEEWDYIYSGEKGTTMRGTGWADTFIYDSASILVYYESEADPGQVKCGVFKWLNAGWIGINLVKPAHIRKGMERFAKDFCKVVESPSLEDTESLVQEYQKIQSLPLDELKAITAAYYNQKNINRFQMENSQYKRWIRKLFKEDNYINGLSRQELEAFVSIQYLKYRMGKYNSIEPEYFPVSSFEERLN